MIVRKGSNVRRFGIVLLMMLSCSHGAISVGGTVVSSATRLPIREARVFLYENIGDEANRTCDELLNSELSAKDEATTGDNGRFEVQGPVYNGCSTSCTRGVLCITHAEYETYRLQYDDCENDEYLYRAPEDYVIELKPL
jgi:hypothetical protein